ncbi:hypothetical protein M2444_003570 [Paenibacillus sp. PastF-3]|uniref:hypothetical protein n=1 Tax=Paenibacillus sp. PastF-3 TaxID=2940626 RepID=UPI002473D674|nr:hypothetical protein [Paenibacillus sp. PastF-3]MDH6371771.1 hypothetical protein [Paenibacillus sp. PastF-3]
MRTKEENRAAIAEQFAPQRDKLGERFDALVDEISAVRYEYLQKRDKLPKQPIGIMDANAAEERRLNREEAMKWVLIKQKYGI